MAVTRLSLAQITTEIFRITGFSTSALSPWLTDANLYVIINLYGQRLPIRCAQAAQTAGFKIFPGNLRFDMWKTFANLTAASGSSTVYFPTDYDHWISFYDNTNTRKVSPLTETSRWHISKLKIKPAGPPEAIEILDFVLNGATWQRRGLLWPPTASGVTPSIECYYWRLPASFPGVAPTTEYPDADYKYHPLFIYGPLLDILRPADPTYEKYRLLEKELLLDLAATAKAT